MIKKIISIENISSGHNQTSTNESNFDIKYP